MARINFAWLEAASFVPREAYTPHAEDLAHTNHFGGHKETERLVICPQTFSLIREAKTE